MRHSDENQILHMGYRSKTIKDAKGYTKVLVLIVIAFLLAGMYDAILLQEGGAL